MMPRAVAIRLGAATHDGKVQEEDGRLPHCAEHGVVPREAIEGRHLEGVWGHVGCVRACGVCEGV